MFHYFLVCVIPQAVLFGCWMLGDWDSFFIFYFLFVIFLGTEVDNLYSKCIWYTDAYIHTDNYMYTSPSHADSHSHLHVHTQIHTHLEHIYTPIPARTGFIF